MAPSHRASSGHRDLADSPGDSGADSEAPRGQRPAIGAAGGVHIGEAPADLELRSTQTGYSLTLSACTSQPGRATTPPGWQRTPASSQLARLWPTWRRLGKPTKISASCPLGLTTVRRVTKEGRRLSASSCSARRTAADWPVDAPGQSKSSADQDVFIRSSPGRAELAFYRGRRPSQQSTLRAAVIVC
jgi:hypothetical protein